MVEQLITDAEIKEFSLYLLAAPSETYWLLAGKLIAHVRAADAILMALRDCSGEEYVTACEKAEVYLIGVKGT